MRRHRVCAMLVMMVLGSGAAALAASTNVAAQPGVVAERCALPPGWSEVAARRPRFVVFGEMHGTQEAPAFFGDVACALATQGKRILVAIEHGADQNDAYQAAWRLPVAAFPAALLAAGWADGNDGRHSEAMLTLLIRLHRLAQEGRTIDIVAFNGARDDVQARRFAELGQGAHDGMQAENIRVAADARRYDQVLVLVGNIHARIRAVDRFAVPYEPMAMRLAPAGKIVSLQIRSGGGSSWACMMRPGLRFEPGKPMPTGAISCGAHPIRAEADLRRPPFVALPATTEAAHSADYDGFFQLGRISASPPAVSEAG